MPVKKKISKKQGPSKYTLWRSKEDVKNLERLRESLDTEFDNKSYVTDSKLYKDLPELYLNAVKKTQDLDHQVDVLTAKLDELEILRASFCRIIEICGVKK